MQHWWRIRPASAVNAGNFSFGRGNQRGRSKQDQTVPLNEGLSAIMSNAELVTLYNYLLANYSQNQPSENDVIICVQITTGLFVLNADSDSRFARVSVQPELLLMTTI